MEKINKPEPGKQYALTGVTGAKCIANGFSWEESVVTCPICEKPFIHGTCRECDELVANL